MSATGWQRPGNDPGPLERRKLADGVWVHVPEPTAVLVGSFDDLTPIPDAVLDMLRAPTDRVQRIVTGRWTTWTLRPVRFRIDPAAVDADHLVIAVGPGVVNTAGRLPDATGQLLAETDGTASIEVPSGDAFAAMVLGDLLDDVGQVIDRLDDEVEDIETAVFAPGRPSVAERIYLLKREVQTVRRCIGPLPEVLATDVADRTARPGAATDDVRGSGQLPARARRLVERLLHVDELLDSVLTAHLARVAIQQNDDMRRISAWVAIVAAPTAMASVYGMNFRFMPELGWRWGYPLVLVVMLVVCVVLYRLFRRSGWL